MNIDGLFFDNHSYKKFVSDKMGMENPLVLPTAAVELENSYDLDKIDYCLWKLMCIRTQIRILICYQSNTEKNSPFKSPLGRGYLATKSYERNGWRCSCYHR